MKWNENNIQDLTDKIAIVTGGNSGLGLETVRVLALKNCKVIMASRNIEKASPAKDRILTSFPNADIEIMQLNLADLTSVREFAEKFNSKVSSLDLLINNAGVMDIPYSKTKENFEMQLGTNHFGHFALTGLLLDKLLQTENSRIVTLSSMIHKYGNINFNDLNSENKYSSWGAYAQSKLANLLFAYELQRKFEKIDTSTISVAAHPGYTATNLQMVGAELRSSSIQEKVMSFMNKYIAQKIEMGALPTLYAATADDINGGDYVGPEGFMEMSGYPKKVSSSERSHSKPIAERLWMESEKLTGVTFQF